MILRRRSLAAAAAALVGALCAASGQEPAPSVPKQQGPKPAPAQPPKPEQAPSASVPTTLRSPIPGEVTVMSVVPAGRVVKKGDVLVVLDDSGLLDPIADAKIEAERAEAARKIAEIDRGAAEIAAEEYRKGTLEQELKEVEQQIALAESRRNSSEDEVQLARRNYEAVDKEIAKTAYERLRSSEARLREANFGLQSATVRRKVLKEFTAPRKVKELEGAAKKALAEELAASLRLELAKDKLRRLEILRAACRVKAPADGTFQPEIEEGDTIKFRKRLGRFEPSAAPATPKGAGE